MNLRETRECATAARHRRVGVGDQAEGASGHRIRVDPNRASARARHKHNKVLPHLKRKKEQI